MSATIICHDGRELRHIRTESKEQDGIPDMGSLVDVQIAAAVDINPVVCISNNAEKNK